MPPVVTLLSQHPEPIRSLYMAFRVCYSSLTPEAILKRIRDERITEEQMLTFVEERLKTGHVSPLEQVWFEFGISGVSRAFSHQFVRTRVGMSPEQQSQRYVVYQDSKNDAVFPYITPPEVTRRGFSVRYERLMTEISRLYSEMIDAGVPGEDARFVLPNATSTNLKVTINFAALLHVSDLRLCFQAQWEYRRVAALMRAEIKKVYPMLAIQLQPKCGEKRLGYCDESIDAWEKCPLGGLNTQPIRPHKSMLFGSYDGDWGRSPAKDLNEDTLALVTE